MQNENKNQGKVVAEPSKFVSVLKSIGAFLLDLLLRVVFVFRDLGIAVWHGIVGIKNAFVKFGKRFKDGSIWTKLSHFVMGLGNFARGQIVKGCIFLIIEVAFILFLALSPKFRDIPMGVKGIENFFTLGDYHSMPIDEEYNFDAEFDAINTSIKLHSDDYEAEENKAYRILQLFAATNKETKGFAVEDNNEEELDEEEFPYYEYNNYNYVIRDARYRTTADVYGYLDTTIKALNASNSKTKIFMNDYIWLFSDKEISFYDIASQFTITSNGADANENLHIYASKEKISVDGDAQYAYLILNRTEGSNQVIKFNGIDDNVTVRIISYNDKLVNVECDNSYLILLFGIVTFAFIAIFLIIYNLAIASSYKADKDIAEGKKPTSFLDDLKTLLDSRFHITLLGPAILFLVVFTIVPTLLMILISFTDLTSTTAITGNKLINWTGFVNFVDLFSGASTGGSQIANEVGKNFGAVITWTFEWAIIATFSCYFGGIFLAILINKKDVKFKKLWRTIFILTIAIPQFISLLILKSLLNELGPVNQMLVDLGIISDANRINFLQQGVSSTADMGQVWLARGSVLLINLYIGIPYTMLMTSGILMNIPKDLYEAATIDGANKWQMFRKITLPYVIFVTTPYLISSFIGNMTSFNTIFLTTGGGPGIPGSLKAGHTDLLVTWLYKLTMEDTQYNAGSIIGILTFLITAFITLVCYRNSKAYKEEDTFQ